MKILVSALEHSANVHLKSLKKELSKEVEFIGIFDESLGKPIVDLRSLAIMGFVDAIKKLRFFFKLNDKMLKLSQQADKVLLIDSSGFNLPLAKKIKKNTRKKRSSTTYSLKPGHGRKNAFLFLQKQLINYALFYLLNQVTIQKMLPLSMSVILCLTKSQNLKNHSIMM